MSCPWPARPMKELYHFKMLIPSHKDIISRDEDDNRIHAILILTFSVVTFVGSILCVLIFMFKHWRKQRNALRQAGIDLSPARPSRPARNTATANMAVSAYVLMEHARRPQAPSTMAGAYPARIESGIQPPPPPYIQRTPSQESTAALPQYTPMPRSCPPRYGSSLEGAGRS